MTGFESDDGVQAQTPTGRLTGQGALHSVSTSDGVGAGGYFAHGCDERLIARRQKGRDDGLRIPD